MHLPKRKKRLILPLLLALLSLLLSACSGNASHDAATSAPLGAIAENSCAPDVPLGNIVGFGVNGQPRNWGTDGRAVKPALNRLVDDLGADIFRVEINSGQTDYEVQNDDSNPNTFNWTAYDAIFASKSFTDLFDYVRYLNALNVSEIILAEHGWVPSWMGVLSTDGSGMTLPTDQNTEDEYIETVLAVAEYAVVRAPDPKPRFTLISPWNEIDWGGRESVKMDPSQAERILKRLIRRMATMPELNGINIATDAASIYGLSALESAINGDAEFDNNLKSRLRAYGWHRYDTTPASWGTSQSIPAWLTEFNANQFGCFTPTWTNNARPLFANLLDALNNGFTAGLVWTEYDAPHSHSYDAWETFGLLQTQFPNVTDYCSLAPPSDAQLDTATYTPKPTYYAARHVMHWVHRGAAPISVSIPGITAWGAVNLDRSVAVAGMNNNAGTYTVTLGMASPPASLTPYVSVNGTYNQVGAPIALTNGVGSFTLPANSIFTLATDIAGNGGSGGVGGASGAGGSSAGAGAGGRSSGGMGGMAAGNGGQAGQSNQGGMSGSGGASAGTGGTSAGAGAGGQSGAGASGAGGSAAGTGGSGGMATAVQYRASSYTQSIQSTSVTRSANIQGGDEELLVHASYNSTSITSTPPNGFTLITSATRSTGSITRLWVYGKQAAGSPGQQTTEPTSYTVTNSGNQYQDLLLFSITGQDPSAPFQTSTTSSGAGTSMSVPGITTARPGSLGLWIKIGFSGTTSVNPSGWTMIAAHQDSVNDLAWRAFNTGTMGNVTSTQSPSDAWVNAFIMAQPSP